MSDVVKPSVETCSSTLPPNVWSLVSEGILIPAFTWSIARDLCVFFDRYHEWGNRLPPELFRQWGGEMSDKAAGRRAFRSSVWNTSLIIWVCYPRGYAMQLSFRDYLTNQYDKMQILFLFTVRKCTYTVTYIYIYTRFTLQIPLQMIHFRTCFCQTVLYHLWNLWANSKPPSWTQRVDPLGIESMNPCERIHPIKEESLMKYNEISWSGWSCGFCMKVVWLQIDTPELYYLYYLGRPVSLMLCCFSQVYCIYFYNLCIYIYINITTCIYLYLYTVFLVVTRQTYACSMGSWCCYFIEKHITWTTFVSMEKFAYWLSAGRSYSWK